MGIFIEFYTQIFPYLLAIPFGYWIQRKGIFPKSWLTNPLIYVLMPVLVIHHVLEADPVKVTVLPVMAFALALAMVLPALLASKTFAQKYDVNLLKSSFSFFNVAFFGIPIVAVLFGKESITVLICIYIGTALYGDIVGYYQMARSTNSRKASIAKIFQVPFIYAFVLAVFLKLISFEKPDFVSSIADVFGVVVSFAGMMIIGSNLSNIKFKGLDWPFISKLTVLRLFSAIGFMAVLMLAEYHFLDVLELEDRKMLAVVALFPVAANVTVFASFFGSEEENSALLVLVTLVVSLLLVPLLASFF
ncbi:AEC family transporter [Pararhodonellum marinum]|uniref:AEC family transporter n=1 Tax=Pararhodonellum marinum TaxID=2755358 RepID=UPI00188DED1D|nr:AEC family transporter [Pararhodonellum marinum]